MDDLLCMKKGKSLSTVTCKCDASGPANVVVLFGFGEDVSEGALHPLSHKTNRFPVILFTNIDEANDVGVAVPDIR